MIALSLLGALKVVLYLLVSLLCLSYFFYSKFLKPGLLISLNLISNILGLLLLSYTSLFFLL